MEDAAGALEDVSNELPHDASRTMRCTSIGVCIEETRISERACNVIVSKLSIWDGLIDRA
jgi:hypothetical protein